MSTLVASWISDPSSTPQPLSTTATFFGVPDFLEGQLAYELEVPYRIASPGIECWYASLQIQMRTAAERKGTTTLRPPEHHDGDVWRNIY